MTGSKVSSRARMYEERTVLCLLPTLVLSSLFLPSFLPFAYSFFPPFSTRTHTHTWLRAVRSSRRHSLARSRSFQETLFRATSASREEEEFEWPLGNKGATRVWKSSGGSRFSHYYIHGAPPPVFRALDSNEISKEALRSARSSNRRTLVPSDNKECPGGVLGATC